MSIRFSRAPSARHTTRHSGIIHAEVRALETSIYADVALGNFSTSIISGTTITDLTAYYNVYYGIIVDATMQDHLSTVTAYFTNKGYAVKLFESPANTSTLGWSVNWIDSGTSLGDSNIPNTVDLFSSEFSSEFN